MDTTGINPTKTNSNIGIKIGNDDAPIKLIEFINLRCPYCRQWFNESKETLETYVANGNVQRVIKLFDKTKESLLPGNVMHQYVARDDEQALQTINEIFNSQDDWGNLPDLDAVARFAENELGLSQSGDKYFTEAIIAEADAAGIKFIPTMVLNEHIFDQKISQGDFKELLNNLL